MPECQSIRQANMNHQQQEYPPTPQPISIEVKAQLLEAAGSARDVADLVIDSSQEQRIIWRGVLEWIERPRDPQKLSRHIKCQVSSSVVNNEVEVKADQWPNKMLMQLIPKHLVSILCGAHLHNAHLVMFHLQECEALEALTRVMSTGSVGCVHPTGLVHQQAGKIKLLMLLYNPDTRTYVGLIPNDQAAFFHRIRTVVQHRNSRQGQQMQLSNYVGQRGMLDVAVGGVAPQLTAAEGVVTAQFPNFTITIQVNDQMGGTPTLELHQLPAPQRTGSGIQQQPQLQVTVGGAANVVGAAAAREGTSTPERQVIWQGVLEWYEKTRDSHSLPRHVPCQVSASVINGQVEVKADHWPGNLLMQLIPKTLISNFGGTHFHNARSVMFHPQDCEALEALANVMSTGYVGCVHFTGMVNPRACDIKVLVFVYSPNKRAYVGFIPNDQAGFIDRIRYLAQQQVRELGQQGQPPQPVGSGVGPSGVAFTQMNSTGGQLSSTLLQQRSNVQLLTTPSIGAVVRGATPELIEIDD